MIETKKIELFILKILLLNLYIRTKINNLIKFLNYEAIKGKKLTYKINFFLFEFRVFTKLIVFLGK